MSMDFRKLILTKKPHNNFFGAVTFRKMTLCRMTLRMLNYHSEGSMYCLFSANGSFTCSALLSYM
jgi:hypothetical protein